MRYLRILIIGWGLLSYSLHGEMGEIATYSDYPPEPVEEKKKFSPPLLNAPNLEDKVDSFVLETKRIFIEEYPFAFNPSVIRWQNRLLMAFRTYHPLTRATNEIGITYLNEDCDPVGSPKLIKFLNPHPFGLDKKQDPRLFSLGGELFLIFNNAIKGEVRRLFIGKIECIGDDFIIDSVTGFFDFEGEREIRSEKNWVPFDCEGRLHMAYSLLPHTILSPTEKSGACETISSTLSPILWNWGVLRGGTPALLENGEYLSFFHSSKNITTVHSEGQLMLHYFMGAYTFSAKSPFQITKISPKPIIGKNFYEGPSYKTWKPLRAVFPGGFVADETFIWLFYGRQDHEIWVAKLDKKELLNSLIPCD